MGVFFVYVLECYLEIWNDYRNLPPDENNTANGHTATN